jgi:hypothetical protein
VSDILYVYAIARGDHPGADGVETIAGDGLAAFFTRVDGEEFSQEAIDARSKDVEWLGAIGYRHQETMVALARGGTIIPLRAFTLFGGDAALRTKLRDERAMFVRILERLDGKQEWTLRVEFEPQRWSEALVHRVDSLRALSEEIDGAAAGRAFLLRKKLDDEKKRASKEAEEQVLTEIERAVLDRLKCETVAETRQQRSGAFPQINVLINRDEEALLQDLRAELEARYGDDGVRVALTGPWPPYTFATMSGE